MSIVWFCAIRMQSFIPMLPTLGGLYHSLFGCKIIAKVWRFEETSTTFMENNLPSSFKFLSKTRRGRTGSWISLSRMTMTTNLHLRLLMILSCNHINEATRKVRTFLKLKHFLHSIQIVRHTFSDTLPLLPFNMSHMFFSKNNCF
jgi:hypothetical protein